MEQNIKPGDIVRLTDPISNGQIVRIESVDEHGFASWLGGAQKGDMEQIDMADINSDLLCDYQNLSELVGHIEAETDIKLYSESAVNYWKYRAEVAEQSNALNVKLLKEEHNKLLDVQDRRKEWEETADELNKELCKTQKERDELRERNAALKRQLDESNRQIEIYAKKVRNLEADLDEGGFNDLKKDILTLVNLIPCNDGNESVINDIKNLLK